MARFTEYPKSKDEHDAMQIVKHMTIKDAAWSIVALEHQRNQLREALSNVMADMSGGNKACGHDFDCICAGDKARAALKATEE